MRPKKKMVLLAHTRRYTLTCCKQNLDKQGLPLLLYYHAHSIIEAIAGEDSSRANHFRATLAQTCVVCDLTLGDGERRDLHDHTTTRHGAIKQLALSTGAVNLAFITEQSTAMASGSYRLART